MFIRQMKKWEDPEISGIRRLKPHVHFYEDSRLRVSLNGEWKFKMFEAPECVNDDALNGDCNDWNNIAVPGTWQTQGYDQMWYADVWYQFPLHAPYVPELNPTGVYRREFTVDKKSRKLIHFDGVDSAYDVYVNGQHVGYSKVSRLPSEFEISDYLVNGNNELAVVVYKYSDGTYLEDQDEWWLSGIFRDVYLLDIVDDEIADCRIKANAVDEYKNGLFEADIETDQDTTVSVSIYNDLGQRVYNKELETSDKKIQLKLKIKNVKLWNAEEPNLYKLVLKTAEQKVSIRFGFRTIEIIDGALCLNGKELLLNGVNHHDFSPISGRYVTYDQVKDDIILMKQHNINALRCSHYPSIDALYDLCDEFGLYVIDETDLECNGYGRDEYYDFLSNDPYYAKAYVDRCTRMVARDFDHPSIIMWSLGNEAGFGCNFKSMAEAIKEMDDSRLLHYEGDKEAVVCDVYSTMYTRLNDLEDIAQGQGKPHVLCEYGHAMGNGPGNLRAYQDLFRNYKRLSGGFVWEWYDHGILSKNEEGVEYYRYGGDYGEYPHNSNFCIDGLLMPDRNPSPALKELKQVICPIEIKQNEKGKLIFKNWYDFACLDDIVFRYEYKAQGKVLLKGSFSIELKAGETVEKTIKQPVFDTDDAVYLNIRVCLNKDKAYANAGHELGLYQFLYQNKKDVVLKYHDEKELAYSQDDRYLIISNDLVEAKFDLLFGKLDQLAYHGESIINEGPCMTLYRPTIDNDMYKKADWLEKYFIQLGSEQLEGYELIKLKDRITVSFHKYFGCLSQIWGYELVYRYVVHGNGRVDLSIEGNDVGPHTFEPEFFPRVGVVLKCAKELEKVTYYGLGPNENYVDSKEAAYKDVFETDADSLFTNYVYPQENGHHEACEWLSLGNKVRFSFNKPVGFNVSKYSDEKIERAKHPYELVEDDYLTLHIDAAMSGLGSNSCGMEQREEDKVRRGPFSLEISLEPIDL